MHRLDFPICCRSRLSERYRELFQSSTLINVFSIPGRCPGLELANAFGINTGQLSDVGESSMSLPSCMARRLPGRYRSRF